MYFRLWLCLLCVARQQSAGIDLSRQRGVGDGGHDVVRSRGGLDRRKLHPRLRYSGTSLGYQLASIIAGGPAPIIATALFAAFNSSLPIAVYIALCAVIGIIATALLTDYTNKDISAEYAGV